MSKKLLKRVLSMIVVCVTLLSTSMVPVLAADIMPYYNNVVNASGNISVSSSGEMTMVYRYVGNSTTTRAEITTTVEKKTLLFFWSDVAEWSDTVYDMTYYDTATLQLEDEGTYRVTIEYVFYGTGGAADTITCEFEVEY